MAFPDDWARKCPLVIQSSQVDSTLANFAVMLTEETLPSEMFDADGSYPALSTGGDIRFSSDLAGDTQLPCEIEYFVTDNDPANGKAVIWVKISSISSSANTTIYIWYNKSGEVQPGRATTYGLENVWNSNYMCVLHMNQDPSGGADCIIDSTSNENHGTPSTGMTSSDLVDGKYGKAIEFNTGGYVDATYVSSSSFSLVGDVTADWTVGKSVKINCGADGFRYGTIDSSVYTSVTTIIITSTGGIGSITDNCIKAQYIDYIRVPHHTSLGITGGITVQAIGYPTDTSMSYGNWVGKDRSEDNTEVNYRICYHAETAHIAFFFANPGNWYGWEDTDNMAINNWYNVVVTKADNYAPVLYTNNNTENCSKVGWTGDPASANIDNPDLNDVIIGACDLDMGGYSNIINDWFEGKLDQIRIVDTVFSADWVDAEYNNWNSPSTFIIEGSPVFTSFTISGTIKVEGMLKARKVYAYTQSTGALLGSTTSASDGTYSIVVSSDADCFVVTVPIELSMKGDLASSITPL